MIITSNFQNLHQTSLKLHQKWFQFSNSTRILNKMATKLAPSDSLEAVGDRQGILSKLIESGTRGVDSSVSDTGCGTGSYNNIESPISIASI